MSTKNRESAAFRRKLKAKLWERRGKDIYPMCILKIKGKTVADRSILVQNFKWTKISDKRMVKWDCNETILKEHKADPRVDININHYKLEFNSQLGQMRSTVHEWDIINGNINWETDVLFYIKQIIECDVEEKQAKKANNLNDKAKKKEKNEKEQREFDEAMVTLKKEWKDELLFKNVMKHDGLCHIIKVKKAYCNWDAVECKKLALKELKKIKLKQEKDTKQNKMASKEEVDNMVSLSIQRQNMALGMNSGMCGMGGMPGMGGMSAMCGMPGMGGMGMNRMNRMGSMNSMGMNGMCMNGMGMNGMGMNDMGMNRMNVMNRMYAMNDMSGMGGNYDINQMRMKQIQQQQQQELNKYQIIPPIIPTPAKQICKQPENNNNSNSNSNSSGYAPGYAPNHSSSTTVEQIRYNPITGLPNIHETFDK